MRTSDAREPFTRSLALPRGPARELVRDRDREYHLRGSEVRMLSTIGAFRIVRADDIRDGAGRAADPRAGDLRHLREEGLVRTVLHVLGGTRTTLVTLTDRGRTLLEQSQHRDPADAQQAFYAGIVKPRELSHDAHLYRAYVDAARRLLDSGHDVRRVVLDYELKRDYQRFLHELDRARRDEQDAAPRDERIAAWAHQHALPIVDGHVRFPDVRIEYTRSDRSAAVEDVEVLTPQYRGAFAAAKARSGFSTYRVSASVGGRSRSGRSRDPHLAERMLG